MNVELSQAPGTTLTAAHCAAQIWLKISFTRIFCVLTPSLASIIVSGYLYVIVTEITEFKTWTIKLFSFIKKEQMLRPLLSKYKG